MTQDTKTKPPVVAGAVPSLEIKCRCNSNTYVDVLIALSTGHSVYEKVTISEFEISILNILHYVIDIYREYNKLLSGTDIVNIENRIYATANDAHKNKSDNFNTILTIGNKDDV